MKEWILMDLLKDLEILEANKSINKIINRKTLMAKLEHLFKIKI